MDVNKLIADLWKSVCGLQGEVRVIQTGGNFWGISGNLGITPDYFLGTIEAQPLVIKTDSVERFRVTPTGNIGFKTDTPTTDFDFNGIVRIRGGNPGAGKILQSDADGVASWVTPAGVTMSANNGLTVNAGNVVFGQDPEQAGDPGALLSSREVPMGNNNIYWTTGIGKHFFGYPDTSPTPFFAVDIRGNLGVTQGLNYPYYGFVGGAGASINLVHGNGSYGMAITRAGGNNNGANLAMFRTWGGTADVKAAVPPGNMIGRISFQAVGSDNNSITIGSSIIGYAATAALPTIVQSWFAFTTTGDDGGQSYIRTAISSHNNVSFLDTHGLVNMSTGESDNSKLRLEQVLTGSNAYSTLSITPTWNTTGIPTAIKMNVTDTASDAASLLMDIQLGGNSRFKISKTLTDIAGQVAIRGGSPGAGKVLTSDGTGVASWQTLPAGGTLTGADKGLSVSGTIVELGQTVGDGTNPALLSETRQIPMTIGSGALQFIAPSNALLAQTFTAANHSIQGTSTVSPTLQMLVADLGNALTVNWDNTALKYVLATTDGFRIRSSTGVPLTVEGDEFITDQLRVVNAYLTNNSVYTYLSNAGGSAGYVGFGFSNTKTPSSADSYFDIYQGPAAAPSHLFTFKGTAQDSTGSNTAQDILRIIPTINQTGGSNGTIRGIYYGPTITNLNGTHIAMQIATGNVLIDNGDVIVGARTNSVGRFSVEKTFTTLNVHAFDDYSTLNPSSGGFGYGTFDASGTMIGSQINDHFIGYQSRLTIGAGSTTNINGDYGLTGLLVFNHHLGSGTITNAHGVFIKEIDGTGPITNQYGLRIAPVNRGTNNFAIWTEAGKVRFLDPVMIGTHTVPIAQLDVRSSTQDQTAYIDNTKAAGIGVIINSSNAAGGSIAIDITASGAGGSSKGLSFAPSSMGSTDWNYYANNNAKFYNKGSMGVGNGTSSPTAQVHIAGAAGYDQLRLETSYTPSGTADTNGHVGDVAWDDSYLYMKTSAGWKRAALSTF